MKRLQPKNTEAPKAALPTMAKLLLDNARRGLKQYICSTAGYLYRDIFGNNPNYAEDEACTIPTGDLCDNLYINVTVGNTYDENTVTNRVEIAEIVCFLDDSIAVRDEDGNEWDDCDLSLEALAEISDALQLTYRHRTKSN